MPVTDVRNPARGAEHDSELEELRHAVDHAAHLLPAQGPITVFVHHNTLHAFEALPFDEAVVQGGRVFGCEPYLSEDRYRQLLSRGRIRPEDLKAILAEDIGPETETRSTPLGSRLEVRLTMMLHPMYSGPAHELRWFMAETDALRRVRSDVAPLSRTQLINETRHWVMRDVRTCVASSNRGQRPDRSPALDAVRELLNHFDDGGIESWNEQRWEAFCMAALWRVCRQGVHTVKAQRHAHPTHLRPRDTLREATGEDTDRLVDSVLIPFCAAYLDQGFARAPLPERDQGFWASFAGLYGNGAVRPDAWTRRLRAELKRIKADGLTPLASIGESLDLLGVPTEARSAYISATLLTLRGWAGMIHQVESRGDRAVRPVAPDSLVEYLAVRLVLERLALAFVAADSLGYSGSLAELSDAARDHIRRHDPPNLEQRVYTLFQLAQICGRSPAFMASLKPNQWAELVSEVESFNSLDRRRAFHLAYERRYRIQTLDAVAARAAQGVSGPKVPRYQAVFCIDDREESFRRHLEEYAPDVETFGAAGFFGAAIYYRGAADAHFVPLCPVIIRPNHYVVEEVVESHEKVHQRRARTRRALGQVSHNLHVGSRSFLVGALVAMGLGVLASVPLVARVLFPRLTARLRRTAGEFVGPPLATRLRIERQEEEDHENRGFSVDEMAVIVERLLRDIGLTDHFARLVLIVGHGSSSLNNPHKSAYDCGACGGGGGGPNARTFVRMANDPRVRDRLKDRGLEVPDETYFVAAYHNTCDESVTEFDTADLPPSHRNELERALADLKVVRQRNAHERCRRFESASLSLSPEAALRHVEGRAEDLAQARPECGHATNAVCIVGRRTRNRGLFLDRRSFLVSYDPGHDADNAILTRILQAVIPVCSGINLEYYFSYTDPTGWGCGTKLPHNITGMLGVMDGAASDLRPGLPWQMVEIHEPLRLLFVIETRPEALLSILDANPGVATLVRNGWVQLAVLDPDSSAIQVFHKGQFRPYRPENTALPQVETSLQWYRGWRDHLGYALIGSDAPMPESPR